MTRLLAVISGKGGVGKTTTVVNLGAALTKLNHNVIILDANLTTPNVGLHLGMHNFPITLNDVLEGNASIVDSIYLHEDSGMRVIPAGLNLKYLQTTKTDRLWDVVLDLFGSSDMVLLDAPAGLEKGAKSVMDASEEVLVVTNPEMPAVTDALKAAKVAQRSGATVLGAVINKAREETTAMSMEEVESMLDVPVVAVIPHDDEVRKSVQSKSPVVIRNPDSPAATEFRKLAANIAGVDYEVPAQGLSIVNFLKRVFGAE